MAQDSQWFWQIRLKNSIILTVATFRLSFKQFSTSRNINCQNMGNNSNKLKWREMIFSSLFSYSPRILGSLLEIYASWCGLRVSSGRRRSQSIFAGKSASTDRQDPWGGSNRIAILLAARCLPVQISESTGDVDTFGVRREVQTIEDCRLQTPNKRGELSRLAMGSLASTWQQQQRNDDPFSFLSQTLFRPAFV